MSIKINDVIYIILAIIILINTKSCRGMAKGWFTLSDTII